MGLDKILPNNKHSFNPFPQWNEEWKGNIIFAWKKISSLDEQMV